MRYLLLLPLFLLGACEPSLDPPKPAPPLTPEQTPPPNPSAERPIVQRLSFKLDSTASTGRIKTTLDPHRLAPRNSNALSPLRGSIDATLTTQPDGARSFTIDAIELATTKDARLQYSWTPLIGSIASLIKAGVLTISRHSIPGPIELDDDGSFSRPGSRFKVGGVASVEGRGLILKDQVGKSDEDLSIERTEPVHLKGSLKRIANRWRLYIAGATMRDSFNLDGNGTVLHLTFIANVEAICAVTN